MEENSKTLIELAEEYCQVKYNKTLELLINQLMNQERDVLKSYHHGFGFSVNELAFKDGFISQLLERHFKLKSLEKGKTFVIGDKAWGNFSFYNTKGKDCYCLANGEYIVPFVAHGNTVWLYPLKIDVDDATEGENEVDDYIIIVERKPSVFYNYNEEAFLSFLEKEKIEECKCFDYKTFLCKEFSEEEYNNAIDLIISWCSKIKLLANLPLSKLRKKNKDLFYETLYKNLFAEGYKLSLSESERKIVTSYLKDCPNSNDISRMIYTFAYTLKGFEHDKEYSDYLDLTFILVSVFKIVEVVFSNLLNEEFGNKRIRDSRGNIIDFSNEKLTLGNMKQFFYSSDRDIQCFLNKNQQVSKDTLSIMNRWIDESRNGFLHKDIVEVSNVEQLAESITDSLQLLCNLIILFKQH